MMGYLIISGDKQMTRWKHDEGRSVRNSNLSLRDCLLIRNTQYGRNIRRSGITSPNGKLGMPIAPGVVRNTSKASVMTPDQRPIQELDKWLHQAEIKKKSKYGNRSPDVGLVERFTLIERLHQENYPVNQLCCVIGVYRSSCQIWDAAQHSLLEKDQRLGKQVKSAYELRNRSAGANTVASIVVSQSYPLNRYRAAYCMQALVLMSCQLPKHCYEKAEQLGSAVRRGCVE